MMTSYTSLNDAGTIFPSLAEGNIEIWYFKPEMARILFGFGSNDQLIDPQNLEKTHVLLGKVVGYQDVDLNETLEQLFVDLQGERWSLNGEARELISGLGLSHTSMSMGDIVVVSGKTYLCAAFGWKELKNG